MAKRYKWHPFIRHMGFELMDFDVTETWETRGTEAGRETFAIWWLCLHKGKFIDYFRQCRECGKWLFALVDHQSFCSDSCRKRHASHDQDFREKRRVYMRAYRRAEKEKDHHARASLSKG